MSNRHIDKKRRSRSKSWLRENRRDKQKDRRDKDEYKNRDFKKKQRLHHNQSHVSIDWPKKTKDNYKYRSKYSKSRSYSGSNSSSSSQSSYSSSRSRSKSSKRDHRDSSRRRNRRSNQRHRYKSRSKSDSKSRNYRKNQYYQKKREFVRDDRHSQNYYKKPEKQHRQQRTQNYYQLHRKDQENKYQNNIGFNSHHNKFVQNSNSYFYRAKNEGKNFQQNKIVQQKIIAEPAQKTPPQRQKIIYDQKPHIEIQITLNQKPKQEKAGFHKNNYQIHKIQQQETLPIKRMQVQKIPIEQKIQKQKIPKVVQLLQEAKKNLQLVPLVPNFLIYDSFRTMKKFNTQTMDPIFLAWLQKDFQASYEKQKNKIFSCQITVSQQRQGVAFSLPSNPSDEQIELHTQLETLKGSILTLNHQFRQLYMVD